MKKYLVALFFCLLLLLCFSSSTFARAYIGVELHAGGIANVSYAPALLEAGVYGGYTFSDNFSLGAECFYGRLLPTKAVYKTYSDSILFSVVATLKFLNSDIIKLDGSVAFFYQLDSSISITSNSTLSSEITSFGAGFRLQLTTTVSPKFDIFAYYSGTPVINSCPEYTVLTGVVNSYSIFFGHIVGIGLDYHHSNNLTYGLSGGFSWKTSKDIYSNSDAFLYYIKLKATYTF